MSKKILVALFMLFLLPACASTPKKDVQEEIKPLTIQDVVGMYGEPNFKVSENGITAYAYRYDVNRVNLLNYIPLIRFFFPIGEYENYLYAVFDKNGNLIEFNSDGITHTVGATGQ